MQGNDERTFLVLCDFGRNEQGVGHLLVGFCKSVRPLLDAGIDCTALTTATTSLWSTGRWRSLCRLLRKVNRTNREPETDDESGYENAFCEVFRCHESSVLFCSGVYSMTDIHTIDNRLTDDLEERTNDCPSRSLSYGPSYMRLNNLLSLIFNLDLIL
jgi:hypothetical protein